VIGGRCRVKELSDVAEVGQAALAVLDREHALGEFRPEADRLG
jgi:hypothetical protein